jgi:hypothetical protein
MNPISPIRPKRWCLLAATACLCLTAPARALDFELSFDRKVSASPFTGRVFVLLSRSQVRDVPTGPNWFAPEPFFAVDVRDWQPETPLRVKDSALGFPLSLAKVASDTYWIQAVMDFDQGGRSFAAAEGNGFSRQMQHAINSADQGSITLRIDQIYHERPFQETNRIKLVEIESKLLSAFHGRSVQLRAAVVLPDSYDRQSERRYPVLYEIPGFGGDHRMAFLLGQRSSDNLELLHVILDPACRWGHHVFADSDNNGPFGRALVEELIPALEQRFRAVGTPAARFVTGHSSGGWSSLWLQVTNPDFFGGVWSTAPDPVDFRDFQRINIYKPGANMFVDENGRTRPLARLHGGRTINYKPFSDMEVVMGHGGQLQSFEAVFSARGPDGKPRRLWDRSTGAIDPETARSWQRYDIRLILRRQWRTLGPKLAGKLHIYMGAEDTFYLEGATLLLQQTLAELGSDARVEIFPGKDHGTLLDRSLRQRIAQEMAEQLRRHAPRSP